MNSTITEPDPLSCAVCPDCGTRLKADRTCWTCCDRLCRLCDKPTGSAFVDICWPCWFQKNEVLAEAENNE